MIDTELERPEVGETDLPTLWGDGQHDDTVSLQAWCDFKPVRLTANYIASDLFGKRRVTGGHFLTTRVICIDREVYDNERLEFHDCTFTSRPWRYACFEVRS